jgi:hypothetical protein
MHAEAAEDARDQRLGGGVERAGMDDRVARLDHRQEQSGDRRHAAGESERVLGTFPDAEAVFEDLLIGAVEARIDESVGAARALAGDALEMALARGGIGEDEGRGQEDRRLQRTFRQHRIIAMPHHHRRWLELAAADLFDTRLGAAAGGGAGQLGFGLVGHGALRNLLVGIVCNELAGEAYPQSSSPAP